MVQSLKSLAPPDAGSYVVKGVSPCPVSRSRAIPIPRRESSYAQESIEKEAQRCYEAQCDMSTWRMYNRITSYRQMHPINKVGSFSPRAVTDYLPQDSGGPTVPIFPNLEIRQGKDHQEDGIFDLDL